MTIFVSTDELYLREEWKRLPDTVNTGANIVVSPLSIPMINENFILRHIEAGARFIYYQEDLPIFLEDEERESLLKNLFLMQSLGVTQSQSVLLVKVSDLADLSRKQYTDFTMTWQNHAGIVLYAVDDLKLFLTGLDEYTKHNPIRHTGGANTLLSLPGVIHSMATSLNQTYGLLATLLMLVDPRGTATDKLAFPAKYVQRIRDSFELQDKQSFTYIEAKEKDEKH